MKIPLIWLKDYVETNKSVKEIADSFTKIGLMLDKPVGEDNVLDLEQRLNRSDLLSVLGCARDFAVFENIPLKEPKVKLHKAKPATNESKVEIKVDTTDVNRFNTRVFRNIQVKESPKWLKERLEAYGIESKNNIVDITNYVMLEMGQPMHAQDIDKLPKKEIHIRQAEKGEKIQTLLGTEIELDPTVFVLSSGGVAQVIGGIVGGKNSGVTKNTKDIVLDAGNYNPRAVRRTSRHLKIMNETVVRYDKPLNPKLCELAMNRAIDLILELAGGELYENDDYYPTIEPPQSLQLTYKRLKLISGLDIPKREVKNTLQSLGYAITGENESGLTLEAPYYRTDLEVEDDLVSDILRMYDYNKIPDSALSTPIPRDITPGIYRFEERLRDIMVSLGAHEHISSPLVKNDGRKSRVVLENALSDEASALRLDIRETLHPVLVNYTKHSLSTSLLFEIGKSFESEKYTELRQLGVIDPTDIRSTLATLLANLGINNYLIVKEGEEYRIQVDDKQIGKIDQDSFVLDIELLMPLASAYPPITSSYGHITTLDLSLKLPQNMGFDKVIRVLRKESKTIQSIEVVDQYQDYILVRITWNKTLNNLDKTRLQLVKELKKLKIETRSEI